MRPHETSQALRKIADKIERSRLPYASAVERELRAVVASISKEARIWPASVTYNDLKKDAFSIWVFHMEHYLQKMGIFGSSGSRTRHKNGFVGRHKTQWGDCDYKVFRSASGENILVEFSITDIEYGTLVEGSVQIRDEISLTKVLDYWKKQFTDAGLL